MKSKAYLGNLTAFEVLGVCLAIIWSEYDHDEQCVKHYVATPAEGSELDPMNFDAKASGVIVKEFSRIDAAYSCFYKATNPAAARAESFYEEARAFTDMCKEDKAANIIDTIAFWKM